MIIEVFKTDVEDKRQASILLDLLGKQLPGCRINFDLQDCDRILRVEGKAFGKEQVIMTVEQQGFLCEVLE